MERIIMELCTNCNKPLLYIKLNSKMYSGLYTLIHEEDYNFISKYTLYVRYVRRQDNFYALTCIKSKTVPLHRIIIQEDIENKEVDHINMDGLDNRRCNLRIVTRQQNSFNQRKRVNTTSKFRGVYKRYDTKSNPYRVCITKNNITCNFGQYKTELEAALVYDREVVKLFGQFATLNFKVENERK